MKVSFTKVNAMELFYDIVNQELNTHVSTHVSTM